MGNVKIEDQLSRVMESFILDHSFKMSILIKKSRLEEHSVVYANALALRYFSADIPSSASDFFGECWVPINRKMRKLHNYSDRVTEFERLQNGVNVLYEVEFQFRTEDCGCEYICIVLCERQDIAVERASHNEIRHKYQSVIDHNLDPIITIDQNLRIIHANRALHLAFGYRFKELSGRSIPNLMGEEKLAEFHLFLSRALAGESIEMEGSSFFHKSGYLLPVYLKAIPVLIDEEVKEIHLILRDTSIHQENNEKLLFLSFHDHLTGLWNRRAMKEHFTEDSTNAVKNDERLSFIHLGLDRFKMINESLGHTVADEVLKIVAERLKMICPASARLYRNGGDEFIVSLRNHSVSMTEKFAQTLLNDFGKPFYYNHQEYFISASIGIAVHPEDGTTLEELLRKTEQALVFVKDRGRSHYRFYQEEMNSFFPDEALMESHLRRAIELDELTIHYQPQVDLKTGNISSFEALLRWNNRKFGFVSPVQFIPIAEESGLIHGIGDWVVDQVCSQLKEWQDKRFKEVRIAVNISPKQFRMENFADKLKEKIARHAIVPSSLEVEITESALTKMDETVRTLNELKKIGVVISVDDFGTGYSSLSYLKQYPIDIIKIDRSFIKDIETDVKNEAIAKTIINLAHNLGMDVIAEGVEKDLQAQILLEAKCQKAQGFLYSRAVPVEEIVEKYFA
ncbi:bifunctional diguanylate cyclase/phosphodiesterase [Sporosarcina sp. JAI121]|uniref:putative bifunctional diguanylate cyclase/phosphodiesterase n=1 Tax=Sporosarcina sp. JAI121 TaxID=2723064 RepID=UPI0015C8AF20|nr:bifunctional diguanylate cyclase/phosphodiesterase [Sporosarcina sp. JAI121]NYF24059.1 diguanylate cyclase (GGDEF)-like protein/PAS domain S-box-containing protein [Sporosarcina sp. JAI121]